MRENPKVCFEVNTMENMDNWKSVICWEEFEELTNGDERKKEIQKLLDRVLPLVQSKTVQIMPHCPFPPKDLNKVKGIVYRAELVSELFPDYSLLPITRWLSGRLNFIQQNNSGYCNIAEPAL